MNITREFVVNEFKNILDEKKAINLEKSILNFSIDYANEKNVKVSWESYSFTHIYKQKFINVKNMLRSDDEIIQKIMNKQLSVKSAMCISRNDILLKTLNPNDQEEEVVDGLFECRKCGSKKTTYYSLQTRSADEPMTNFITCTTCLNRWKM